MIYSQCFGISQASRGGGKENWGGGRDFLVDIARNPISGVVARYTRMGINRYQGNQIQGRLLEKSLISWKPVSMRKGRLKVLVLTDEGKKAIPEVKIEKNKLSQLIAPHQVMVI